ncbi:type VI secretion system protein TssR domain-containing protein [Aureivirga marina]|uniref:type VI secretion system protein TssR domain-containing protein n=1 Tax=Aureivirga marina TaxID=1182451 RepID=UPI0018CBAC76|nr:type VI secretion system protein TssR domain-containing protein [Aureivirga marina]
MQQSTFTYFFVILCFIFFPHKIVAQVGNYEKVAIKKEQSFNLDSLIKIKKDKSPLIVYSDRDENKAFLDAYSQKKTNDQKLLDAYFIINYKNDHYELVTYDPKMIGKPSGMFSIFYGKKRTFKDAKSVAYVGWVHKDKLLYYSNAKISSKNFKPIKYVLGIHDKEDLTKLENYFTNDSVTLYSSPALRKKRGKSLNSNQFVYVYKYSMDGKSVLISNQANISYPQNESQIVGWVSSKLVQKMGQEFVYKVDLNDSIFINKGEVNSRKIAAMELAMPYLFNGKENPKNEDNDSTNVVLPIQIWDLPNLRLLNIEGEDFFAKIVKQLEKNQFNFNIHLVFDESPSLKKSRYRMLNGLQTLWESLRNNPKYQPYNFTFSASSYGGQMPFSIKPTKVFPKLIQKLYNRFDENVKMDTIQYNYQLTDYLPKDFDKNPYTPKILIVAGAQNKFTSKKINYISKKLADSNTKLIFLQLRNRSDDSYQNFVLNAKQWMYKTGKYYSNGIKPYSVEDIHFSDKNQMISVPVKKDNLFIYNTPDNSNYQGGIAFPKPNETLRSTSVEKVTDTIIHQIIVHRNTLIKDIKEHIIKFGLVRSDPNKSIKNMLEEDDEYLINRNHIFDRVHVENKLDSLPKSKGYLLDENELTQAIETYKSFLPIFHGEITRKERRILFKILKQNMKGFNNQASKKVVNRKSKIADLIYFKTGWKTQNDWFSKLRLKDIKKKKKISEKELRAFLGDILNKVEFLEKNRDKFKASLNIESDISFYYLPVEKLP